MTSRKLTMALAAVLVVSALAAVPFVPTRTIAPEPLGASGPGPDLEEAARAERAGPIAARSPGSDTNLNMGWESSIAVNKWNPLQVAVVQGNSVRLSQDGGNTFSASTNLAGSLPATHGPGGDGSLAFDGAGRLFMSFIGVPVLAGRWDIFVVQIDPVTGAAIGAAQNVSDQIGMPASMNGDKPWIAADFNLGTSIYVNNLYVVWSVTGGNTSGEWEIWGARSTDQGVTWSPSSRVAMGWGPISPWNAAEGRAWTPHVAVGRKGDVWLAYHAQGAFLPVPGGLIPDGVSGQVPVMRSVDGGLFYTPVTPAFAPGEADITWNMQDRSGRIPDLGIWTIGSNHAWVLPDPDPQFPCRLYVVTADDPDDDHLVGDPSDVVMATSTDCGATWSIETIDGAADGQRAWQLFPAAAIDPRTGFVTVTWYDNRNAASYPAGSRGNSQFDLLMKVRTSGGFWEPVARVNDAPIDADASNSTLNGSLPPTYRFGEYNGVAYGECMAHMVWSGTPVLGGNADTYYDRDPEAGGDVDLPTIFCPADIDVACGDPIDPSFTGEATASDNCDRNPTIGYFDVDVSIASCNAPIAQQLDRYWRAKDEAGSTATCIQQISVLGPCCP